MPRMQSKVSSGDAAKKGASTQETGTDVGPMPTAAGEMFGQFVQVDMSGVKAGSGDGSERAAAGGTGASIPPQAGTPLQAHVPQPPLAARGKSAGRGPGKKTPSTTIDKGMD